LRLPGPRDGAAAPGERRDDEGGSVHLVQLLLPVYDNAGRPFPADAFAELRGALAERFGGLTAYTRAPAEGIWTEGDGPAARDDVVVYEVMADTLDRAWWARLRADLERRLDQQELVVRAHAVERL
jgi:hypothetical protein